VSNSGSAAAARRAASAKAPFRVAHREGVAAAHSQIQVNNLFQYKGAAGLLRVRLGRQPSMHACGYAATSSCSRCTSSAAAVRR
jgi:hypothetical protein